MPAGCFCEVKSEVQAHGRWSRRVVRRPKAGGERSGPVRPAEDLGRSQKLSQFCPAVASRCCSELSSRAVQKQLHRSAVALGKHKVAHDWRRGVVHAAVWVSRRTARWRTHGQVISAQAAAPKTSSESRYHGHGPNTYSSDLATGLVLRKP